MHMTQHRNGPRWKEWVPLATQPLRIRNLLQILAMNVGIEDLEGKKVASKNQITVCFYYTLHSTAMSAPFYTSEKIESDSPKWSEINSNVLVTECVGHSEALVLRLWSHSITGPQDELITVYGVQLSGLLYIGQHLPDDRASFKNNTIIFNMTGGYYVCPGSSVDVQSIRPDFVTVPLDEVRISYRLTTLHRLQRVQRAYLEKTAESSILKQKIEAGEFPVPDNRGSAMLRKLLSKNKPKSSYTDVAKVKEDVEIARFRVNTLLEEKKKMMGRLKLLRDQLEALSDRNQLVESQTMEKYRLLMREVQSHREWLKKHVQGREAQLHSRALLNFRMKQLISELNIIYPVEVVDEKYTICNVHLPDSESFAGHEDLKISVGLGFVAHTVQMISVFLQVPLRYPVIHAGSRSRIVDHIADKIPESEREFPLFCKGKDKLQFNYAVYLLNKNIAQLRCLCGLSTSDLRCTLANLSALLHLTGPDEFYESHLRSPSSSTLDINNSSFSLIASSPTESFFPPRRLLNRQRLSESTALDTVPDRTHCHRVTKSVGSAKDFQLSNIEPQQQIADKSKTSLGPVLPSNLSYSLDKGLNEFKEINKKTEDVREPNEDVPFNTRGSETSLPACLSPRKVSLNERTSVAEEAATYTYLKSWEVERNTVIFSDDDSDLNSSDVFVEKTISSIVLPKTGNPFDEADDSLVQLQTRPQNISTISLQGPSTFSSNESRRRDTGSNSQIHGSSEDGVCVGLEVCERVSDSSQDTHIEGDPTTIVEHSSVVKEASSSHKNELSPTDPLLENVTNRTEALASQSSSFNMFRTRFKSTLGSSN